MVSDRIYFLIIAAMMFGGSSSLAGLYRPLSRYTSRYLDSQDPRFLTPYRQKFPTSSLHSSHLSYKIALNRQGHHHSTSNSYPFHSRSWAKKVHHSPQYVLQK
ncbi:MAG: hypothetical protein KC535_05870 [Nanoarchaeota archaeon]|nr:hypothetical protein [Nanoarchaeota archaeon]